MKKLLEIATSLDPTGITENEWKKQAREWAENEFLSLYDGKDVTPYLHVFVYHLGFFLEKCGSVEQFANYPIESKHQQVKKHRKGNLRNCTTQGAKTAQLLLRDLSSFIYRFTVV